MNKNVNHYSSLQLFENIICDVDRGFCLVDAGKLWTGEEVRRLFSVLSYVSSEQRLLLTKRKLIAAQK